MRGWASILLLPLLLVTASCGGDGTSLDAGDGTVGDTGPGVDAASVVVAAPALPSFLPCATGYREVGEPTRCEPWPLGGRAVCPPFEAHFPGQPGCRPVGSPCPSGEWADGLPTDDVRYVQPGAPADGDGTMARPYATIAEAMGSAAVGTVLALAKGTYDEAVRPRPGVTLWGACSAETMIRSAAPSLIQEGVITVSGAGVQLRNLAVSGAREGVVLWAFAEALLEGVVIMGATRAGVSLHPDARLTGARVLVRETVVAEGRFGYGVALAPGATLSMTHLVVEGSTSAAVATLGTVTLEGSVLVASRPEPRDGNLGIGLEAMGGAEVTLVRSVVEGHRQRALMVYEEGTHVSLQDCVVRGTLPRDRDGAEGRAAFVYGGARLTLLRTWLAGHHEVALLAHEPGTSIRLEDVIIEDTEARMSDGAGGGALALQGGAAGQLERVLFERNRGVAVAAHHGSHLAVRDLTIRETASEASDGRFGVGLHAQSGAQVEGARVALLNNRQAAISAGNAGTVVALTDVEVRGTRERECATTTCIGVGIGDGVLAFADAHISLDGFLVQDSARAGVHVAEGGTMDLRRGRIVDNPIGAVIQTSGFDVARISNDVVYEANGRNLDRSALPLPEPPPAF